MVVLLEKEGLVRYPVLTDFCQSSRNNLMGEEESVGVGVGRDGVGLG